LQEIALSAKWSRLGVLLNLFAVIEKAPSRVQRLAQDLFSKGLLPSRSLRDTLRRIDFRIEMAAAAAQAASAAFAFRPNANYGNLLPKILRPENV
jgi:hypothetical protein